MYPNMERKTYFLDIDGTLLYHIGEFKYIRDYKALQALPGARSKTCQWHCEGHLIIIVTARPESLRNITVEQLDNAGVFYDQLMMGVGAGPRILVNDIAEDYHTNENSVTKAIAYNVTRNQDGIEDVD
tara:strand:+ start:941 stop:1324 length:384 start_codon:yes stop_codon:yes gene_type:complete